MPRPARRCATRSRDCATRLASAIEQAARLLAGSMPGANPCWFSAFRGDAALDIPRIAAGIEFERCTRSSARKPTRPWRSRKSGLVDGGAKRRVRRRSGRNPPNRSQQPGHYSALELDGRDGERRRHCRTGASVVDDFDEVAPVAGDLHREPLRALGEDALAALDNDGLFRFSTRQQMPVLVLATETPRANQSVYVENALRLARAPVFACERAAIETLQPPRTSPRAAVILVNDAPCRAARWRGAARICRRRWRPAGRQPATVRRFTGRAATTVICRAPAGRRVDCGGRLSNWAGSTPIIRSARTLGATDRARSRRGARFQLPRVRSGREDRVLARYDDGGAALLERRRARARAAAHHDARPRTGTIALQPAFVPLLQQACVTWRLRSLSRDTRIGSVVDVLRYARALAGRRDRGRRRRGAGDRRTADGARNPPRRDAALLRLDEPGFYQVHRATPGGVEMVVAANVDPAEAAPAPLDLKRFVEDIMVRPRRRPRTERADPAPGRRASATSGCGTRSSRR